MPRLGFCLILFVVYQISSDFHCNGHVVGQVDKQITQYHSLLDEHLQRVQKVFNATYNEAALFADNLRKNAVETERNVTSALRNIYDVFDAQVDKLKRMRAGIKSRQCTSMAEDCKRTFFEVLISSSRCLTDKLDEAASYIDNMRYIHDRTVKRSTRIKQTFDKCLSKNASDSSICVKNLPLSTMNANNLISEITAMFQKSKKVGVKMTECSMSTLIESLQSKTSVLFDQINACSKFN